VRIRPTLLVCAAALVALSAPGPAAANPSGGVAAPVGSGGSADSSGGSPYGTPGPASSERRRARARKPRVAPALPAGEHVFPVAGPYSLGGEDALFGAPRRGHRHMGHDISAARGTPVVAPFAGAIDWVRFQRGGAGHYVVLDADDDHDYVFMHLRRGSIPVVAGQRVAAGDRIGEIGNSGRSFGAHLHFEVWVGGWYEKGGEAIDPLPLLQDWATR
jgi:murein DD-endopeptidase MepM/ murein hydrolase activator NlpD